MHLISTQGCYIYIIWRHGWADVVKMWSWGLEASRLKSSGTPQISVKGQFSQHFQKIYWPISSKHLSGDFILLPRSCVSRVKLHSSVVLVAVIVTMLVLIAWVTHRIAAHYCLLKLTLPWISLCHHHTASDGERERARFLLWVVASETASFMEECLHLLCHNNNWELGFHNFSFWEQNWYHLSLLMSPSCLTSGAHHGAE